MDVLTGLTLAAPAGLNAYIPLLTVAICQNRGWLELTGPYTRMGDWWFIALIAVLLIVEMIADKVPAVDHVNDAIQTVVRPAAGGLLAVAASGEGKLAPWLMLLAGVLLAGGVHVAKASARPIINTLTGGAGAPAASTVEDVGATGLSIMAIVAPVIAAVLIVIFFALTGWGIASWRRRRQERKAAREAATIEGLARTPDAAAPDPDDDAPPDDVGL